MTLKQLSNHVWIDPFVKQPNITQPNIGVIIDGDETVLVDAGNGAAHARRIQSALAAMGAPPVSRIIYTHHHWDHVFGAHAFDVPVLANERSVPFLMEKQATPWSESFLRRRAAVYPKMRPETEHQRHAVDDWSSFRIVLPAATFGDTHLLRLPSLTLALKHVGGIHSPDSIVVTVVEEGIMFVGDSFYAPPMYEAKPGEENAIDLNVIERFWDDDVTLYVDGHNEPYPPRQMRLLVSWHKMMHSARTDL